MGKNFLLVPFFLQCTSRARWSDLMHCTEVILDRDHNNVLRFIEGHTASHKTMRAEMFKHQFLPLTAPAFWSDG